MIRLLVLILIACIACKAILGKWPWEYLRTAPTRSQALFKARKLLGVPSTANHTEIRAAHKKMLALIHPDRGGTNAQVHEADAARDLLLEELPHESDTPR